MAAGGDVGEAQENKADCRNGEVAHHPGPRGEGPVSSGGTDSYKREGFIEVLTGKVRREGQPFWDWLL